MLLVFGIWGGGCFWGVCCFWVILMVVKNIGEVFLELYNFFGGVVYLIECFK